MTKSKEQWQRTKNSGKEQRTVAKSKEQWQSKTKNSDKEQRTVAKNKEQWQRAKNKFVRVLCSLFFALVFSPSF